MIIELKEYELPKGKQLHDKDAYKETGLYLVNDGVTLSIVAVPKVGEPPFFIPVPFGELSKYMVRTVKQDMSDQIYTNLGEIKRLIEKQGEVKELSEIAAIPQYYTEEKIDGSTLLKVIALVQKPELAEKLLKDE